MVSDSVSQLVPLTHIGAMPTQRPPRFSMQWWELVQKSRPHLIPIAPDDEDLPKWETLAVSIHAQERARDRDPRCVKDPILSVVLKPTEWRAFAERESGVLHIYGPEQKVVIDIPNNTIVTLMPHALEFNKGYVEGWASWSRNRENQRKKELRLARKALKAAEASIDPAVALRSETERNMQALEDGNLSPKQRTQLQQRNSVLKKKIHAVKNTYKNLVRDRTSAVHRLENLGTELETTHSFEYEPLGLVLASVGAHSADDGWQQVRRKKKKSTKKKKK